MDNIDPIEGNKKRIGFLESTNILFLKKVR
jgi:hypothetical protein